MKRDAMESLVDKAMAVPIVRVKRTRLSGEQAALAVAYANGEVTLTQVAVVLGVTIQSAQTKMRTWIMAAITDGQATLTLSAAVLKVGKRK